MANEIKAIFVKNLKSEVDEEKLKAAFEEFGEIVSCSLKENLSQRKGVHPLNDSGRIKFGIVEFATKDQAEAAQRAGR